MLLMNKVFITVISLYIILFYLILFNSIVFYWNILVPVLFDSIFIVWIPVLADTVLV